MGCFNANIHNYGLSISISRLHVFNLFLMCRQFSVRQEHKVYANYIQDLTRTLNLAMAPRSTSSALAGVRAFERISICLRLADRRQTTNYCIAECNVKRLLSSLSFTAIVSFLWQCIHTPPDFHNLTNIHETLEFISYRLRTTPNSCSDF